MRVLAVASELPRPGAESVGIFIQREIDALRALGVEVETFEARYRHGPFRAMRTLRARIREVRPDLIHVYAGSIGALVACLVSPTPVVVTYTGSDLLGAARGDSFLEQMVCRVSVLCSQLAAPRARAIIVCSEQLRRAFWRATDRARAHVIAAGVDLDVFRPIDQDEARRRLGWSIGGPPVVLFGASRHRAVKRFWLAEQAVRGLGGFQARLESLEDVRPRDMPLYLNAADCLLVTSLHEGSPNVVKEAMACACPVVSVAVGDVAEIVHGVHPGEVAPADADALGAALLGVLRDHRGRANGRERVRARHAASDVAGRVLAVYRATLGT